MMKNHSSFTFFLSLLAIVWLSYYTHYTLPTPKSELYDVDGEPQFSEKRALEYVQVMADDIGYRIVGTIEHVQSRDWLKNEIAKLIEELRKDPIRDSLYDVEVLNHTGEGSHRFDFMSKVVMKHYIDIENVVVRISSKTNPRSKENAILVNAHLDSTLPSPGAADDALAIAIQLETLRVLTSRTNVETLDNSVILLFNDAEESLQDASHMFVMQHPWASTVRGVINLEAAGNTGPAILFQATSSKMIEAYGYAPYPYGTVLASDVFATGLILSDTDFRQFDHYGNLTGLDMAVVGNSYAYHTRLDTTANIEPGVAQQFGENTIAILTYLTQKGTLLTDIHNSKDKDPEPQTFFSVLHRKFVAYPTRYAVLASRIVFTLSLGYIGFSMLSLGQLTKGLLINIGSLATALLVSNILAIVLTLSGLQMRWFTQEFSCLLLYVPTTMAGFLIPQLFIDISSRDLHLSALLLYSGLSLMPVGSAFWMFYQSVSLLVSALLVTLMDGPSFLSFFLGSAQAVLFGSEAYWSVLEIFVPLTGRLGIESPAENIIAIIVSLLTFMSWPLLPAFIATMTRTSRLRAFVGTIVAAIAGVVILSGRQVWDKAHPRRLFVQYLYNVTDSTTSLHFANADPAPGFDQYIDGLRTKLGLGAIQENQMDEWISDWDTIYPFSQFLNSFKVELPFVQDFSEPVTQLKITGRVLSQIENTDGTSHVRLEIKAEHPGLIWTVISFDADIQSWSLPMPDPGMQRHHIRQVSVHGTWTHTLDLTIALPAGAPRELLLDFVGVDEMGVWPAKANAKTSPERESIKIFKKLEAEGIGELSDMCSNGVVAGRFKIEL